MIESPIGPIYAKMRPSPAAFSCSSIIIQDLLPDCGFAAALSSLSKTNPEAIDKCFVDWNEKTVTVKLFKVTMYIDGTDVYMGLVDKSLQCVDEFIPGSQVSICVDNTIHALSGQPAMSARWVSILEKAFAIYLKNGFYKNACPSLEFLLNKLCPKGGTMDTLDSIPPEVVLTAITGKKTKYKSIDEKFADSLEEFTGLYDGKALQIYQKIEKKLKEHKPITCSFKNKIHDRIYPNHAYSVLEVKKSSKSSFYYVTVKNSNPAGKDDLICRYTLTKPTDGTPPERVAKPLTDTKFLRRDDKFGTIKMELNEFLKNVAMLSIGTDKVI